MAEAVFAHKANLAGIGDRFHVDSAGTGRWHVGDLPHTGTRKELSAHGVPYSHRARVIGSGDLIDFDYIITMDDSNFQDVTSLGESAAQIRRFVELDPSCGYSEVPDPYYEGNFAEVYALVDRLSDALLAEIRASRIVS